jgi:prepilin-type N-terminal cleavage/methylation domain-containing protein
MKSYSIFKNKKGFTLIEILLVVAVLSILAGIVIVAINPSHQLLKSRNAERIAHLNALDKAMQQYYFDHQVWPSDELNKGLQEICDTGYSESSEVECSGKIDLSSLVPVYLEAIPRNPSSEYNYFMAISVSGNVEIAAPDSNSVEYGVAGVAVGTTTDVIADLY